MRARLNLCLLLALAVGCQPSGGPRGAAQTTPAAMASDAIGAPEQGLPSDLPTLVERGQRIAEEWQDEPVLAEVEVDLDAEHRWTGVRLVYLAGDADRMLQLVGAGSGFTQERPSLASLQVPPVPAAALTELPAFPDDAASPADLAGVEAAAECGVEGAATVLYATGAPFAWDGTTWSSPPQWRGIVTAPGAEAEGARVDVVTGAGDGCLE